MLSIGERFHASSAPHPLLANFAAALLLIAGLLVMHTLSGAISHGHIETGQHSQAVAIDVSDAHAEPSSSTAHCAHACDPPGGTPGHSMLMAACVLALLTAVIGLAAPPLLSVLTTTGPPLRRHLRTLLAAVAPPRPPSLIVLSVSRT